MDAAQNELLTRVGPGTPMGEVLRRHWFPVAGVSEFDTQRFGFGRGADIHRNFGTQRLVQFRLHIDPAKPESMSSRTAQSEGHGKGERQRSVHRCFPSASMLVHDRQQRSSILESSL